MSNLWLRLWHDMPNDPKWRTIARISKQPLSLVQATYIHLLVDASQNVTRGHIGVTQEDLASALDCDISQIEAIFDAMQGRVLSGKELTGWEVRQPKREDLGSPESGAKSAAQRKREQRERERKQAIDDACHDESRNVTTDKEEEEDTDLTLLPLITAPDIEIKNKFAMTAGWLPHEKSFAAVITLNGLDGIPLEQDHLNEFKSFWIASPDEHRTQGKWEHALAQHLKRKHRNGQANGRSSKAGPNQDGSEGIRYGRKGPRSAVDRVRDNVSANEAARQAARTLVGENDGDVRPPLDVEFWRQP